MMGSVLLVGVERGLFDELAHRPAAEDSLTLEEAGASEVVRRLEGGSPLDALVLGASLPDPIALAQRAQAVDRDLSVIILSSAARRDELVRDMQFAPGLKGDVRCLGELDPISVAEDVIEASELTRRRRRHRETIRALNEQLALGPPAQSAQVESLGALLDVAPVGVSAVGPGGEVLAWNRRAERIFERPARQMLGTPLSRLLPPSEQSAWEALLERAPRMAAPARIEVERRRADNQPQQVEITAAPMITSGGNPGLMLMFQDVTEQRAAETERAELLKRTQLALAVRDEFLAVASHELRTPLTSLRLVLQSLIRDQGEEGTPGRADASGHYRKLHSAERQVVRLSRLVEGLLDVSSIQSGRLRLERSAVSLPEVVRRSVADLTDQFARAGCEAVMSLEEVKGAWDGKRLEQVVGHLLTNALRYSPGTPVEIAVRSEGGRAVLEVRDHGVGIDPPALQRIFDRFERAAPARNYGGLGLGLFVSRKIVEAHGGTLAARSAPGKGATFRVELPLANG